MLKSESFVSVSKLNDKVKKKILHTSFTGEKPE